MRWSIGLRRDYVSGDVHTVLGVWVDEHPCRDVLPRWRWDLMITYKYGVAGGEIGQVQHNVAESNLEGYLMMEWNVATVLQVSSWCALYSRLCDVHNHCAVCCCDPVRHELRAARYPHANLGPISPQLQLNLTCS